MTTQKEFVHTIIHTNLQSVGDIGMRILTSLIAICVLLTASVAFAQSTTGFLSIPSSSFTPQTSEGTGNAGYDGNVTGTARLFEGSFLMFAPVNLPHHATVTSLKCGGRAPSRDFKVGFTLRRNDPQQANVDMATVSTTFEGTGFQFVSTTSITSAVINNARFNYYIAAQTDAFDVGFCPECSIGFCTIGYTVN
jgi:hypothetical protein